MADAEKISAIGGYVSYIPTKESATLYNKMAIGNWKSEMFGIASCLCHLSDAIIL
jgi:hypothetical protein